MARLIVNRPTGKEESLELVNPEYSLGRSLDNDLVLEDTEVSRYHCRLVREEDGYLIVDLQSHNGTFVNGQKISRAHLNDGDLLRIGHYLIRFVVAGTSPQLHSPSPFRIEENYDRLISRLTSTPERTVGALDGISGGRLEKERRILRLLLDMGSAFSTDQSVEEVCRKATRILLASTDAERAAIFLLDEEEKRLSPISTCERNGGADASKPIALSRTIADRILSEGKGIVTSDAVTDERFAHGESVIAAALRSVACAPMIGKSGRLGILYMENKTTVGAFTQEDLQLLCAVASQIGLAVENARFYEELKRTNENLEHIVEERTAALAEAQLKLYQAKKIASLSRLVAGVAHEINSPLGALKSNLDLLTTSFGRLASRSGTSGEEAGIFQGLTELGQVSTAACARIVAVVRSLTSFARLDEAEFKVADINEGLRTVVQLLDPALTRHVRLELLLGEMPPIPCFPALLNEAFMNLLVNACQAIEESGEIVVETRCEADSAVITISDTGRGIPQDRLETIFDPGFTTKGVGVGVGLGLAVVYRVIQEHQGSISVGSKVNEGSVFTLRLPLTRTSSAK